MARRRKYGITRQHAEMLEEIRDWLAVTGGSPLEIDIVAEIRDRVVDHAKNAAIVRVRLYNHPNPKRLHAVRAIRRDDARMIGSHFEWSVEELDLLGAYVREGLSDKEIAERLEGRTAIAVNGMVNHLHLKRPSKLPEIIAANRSNALARARERRERTKEEMRRRKESA